MLEPEKKNHRVGVFRSKKFGVYYVQKSIVRSKLLPILWCYKNYESMFRLSVCVSVSLRISLCCLDFIIIIIITSGWMSECACFVNL